MLIIGLETNCKEEWELYFTGDYNSLGIKGKAFHVNDESSYILLYVKTIIVKNSKKILICKNY